MKDSPSSLPIAPVDDEDNTPEASSPDHPDSQSGDQKEREDNQEAESTAEGTSDQSSLDYNSHQKSQPPQALPSANPMLSRIQ